MTRKSGGHAAPLDVIVVGAGPAGLQMGYYLEKAGRDYLILEAADRPGAFFERFPRHRTLISVNKCHTGYDDPETNLRWDWNSLLSDEHEVLFRDFSRDYFPSADAFVEYLDAYARRYRLKVEYGTRVAGISRQDGELCVVDDRGRRLTCRRLLVATGLFQPYMPPIEGIELTEPYTDVSVDPDDFAGQRVLVIGKGNSGFETADNLIGTTSLIHISSPNPLQMAWKTHFVGHLRAVNNNFLDTYQLKSQNAVLDATIEEITKEEGRFLVRVSYTHAGEECETLEYDRVINCTGFRFDDSIFEGSCRPALAHDRRFPDQTSEWESTNVEHLYFGGTLMQMRDYKRYTSGFIHGYRYNLRALYRMWERKYHGRPWPSRAVAPSVEGLTEAIVQRVNRSSALWQQFSFLADLIVMPADGSEARYYEELPVDYVHDGELGRNESYFLVTLEFGKVTGDPFSIERRPVPQMASRSTFLHPVVRHYAGDELLGEHHLLENLFGEWRDAELHREPLAEFLRCELSGRPAPAGSEQSVG